MIEQIPNFHVPKLGDLTPSRGTRFTRAFGRTLLRITGWKSLGDFPNIPKAVYVGAPHTSNWDFPIALTFLVATGIHMSWMGKHTFVNGFLKSFWHYMGGIPIDRRASHGVVGEIVNQFNKRDALLIGLAPEGTRSKVDRWKMGFYHIARGANVPIVPIKLDFGGRFIEIGEPIEAVEDVEKVKSQLNEFYKGAIGRHAQNYTPILPSSE